MSNRTDDLAERGVEVIKRIAKTKLSLGDVSLISGWVHDARNALRAQGGVRVKALEWGATSYGTPEATTVAGVYRITHAWDDGFNVNRGQISFQDEDGRKNFPNIEAAKAAAQADYERRIMGALEASPAPVSEECRKFKVGDRVTKVKGSSWTGHVVGFYSTALTPVGYAVESETERGSVQIYPEAALAAKGGQ